jgi:hypothetical protein
MDVSTDGHALLTFETNLSKSLLSFRPVVRTIITEDIMGRGILLWLLGIPLPIVILIMIFWH